MPCKFCQRPLFSDGVEDKQDICVPCYKDGVRRIAGLFHLSRVLTYIRKEGYLRWKRV